MIPEPNALLFFPFLRPGFELSFRFLGLGKVSLNTLSNAISSWIPKFCAAFFFFFSVCLLLVPGSAARDRFECSRESREPSLPA